MSTHAQQHHLGIKSGVGGVRVEESDLFSAFSSIPAYLYTFPPCNDSIYKYPRTCVGICIIIGEDECVVLA